VFKYHTVPQTSIQLLWSVKILTSLGEVAQTCNPSYSRGRDWDDLSLRTDPTKRFRRYPSHSMTGHGGKYLWPGPKGRPISKIMKKKKKGLAQVVEFLPSKLKALSSTNNN
jgi:hypothetical protein